MRFRLLVETSRGQQEQTPAVFRQCGAVEAVAAECSGIAGRQESGDEPPDRAWSSEANNTIVWLTLIPVRPSRGRSAVNDR